MKPLIQKLWMVMAMLCLSISAYAYDFEVDGIYYTILSLSDGTCSVASGDALYENNVEIPDVVTYKNKTLKVTEVNADAFRDCSNLSEIQMTDNITHIGERAFYGCSSLQSVQVSDNIEIIEELTFAYCSSLKELLLPEKVSIIGNNIVKGCSCLENIHFPSSLVKISTQDLSSCSKLSILTFPAYVQEIGTVKLDNSTSIELKFLGANDSPKLYFNTREAAIVEDEPVRDYGFPHNRLHFALISGNQNSTVRLNRNIVIPEDSSDGSFTAYRYYAFENAPYNLTIEEFVESYNDPNFYYTKDGIKNLNISYSAIPISLLVTKSVNDFNLNRDFNGNVLCENIQIGENVTYLPANGLSNSQFKTLIIPNSISRIESYCFYGCKQLESLEIPSSIKELKEYVFGKCESLKEIILGSSVEKIDETSFVNTDPSLIICKSETPPQGKENTFTKNIYLNANLVVPKNSLPSYMESSPWSNFFDIKYLSPVSEIVLTNTPPVLEVGSEFNFNIEYLTTDELGYPNIDFDLLWSTSNSDVAMVHDGCLKAIGPGSCDVIVKSSNDFSLFASCQIKVVPAIPNEFESDGILYRKIDSSHVKVIPNNYVGEIIIPSQVYVNSIPLEVSECDNNAFKNCEKLTFIAIPGTISELNNDQFEGCVELKSVELSYGDEALKIGYNTYLTLSSTITPFPNPSNVDERRTGFRNGYYDGLFYGLPIEHLVINRDIELPKYYERTMGSSTSNYSTVYNDIIYYPPFYGLTNLKSVELGENVSSICKNQIEAVVNAVPTTMEYINFGKCDNIEVVVSNNTAAPIGGGFSQTVYNNATLFLPNGGEESYKSDDYWKHFSHIENAPFIATESLIFEDDEIILGINENKTLMPIINPEDASIKTFKWSSSAPSIIAVSEDGSISSNTREGDAIITASTCDGTGISASVKVVVQKGAGVSDVLADAPYKVSVENRHIHISGKSDSDIVEIFNIQGQLIISSSDNVIDIYTTGVYIVKIGSFTYKVVM